MTNAISDQQIEELCRKAWEHSPQGAYETYGIPNRYVTGIGRNEFHTRVRYPQHHRLTPIPPDTHFGQ